MQSLHVFLAKLNDRCDSFWQWPNMKFEGWNWYAYGAVCINTLADMMKVICLHKTLPVGHRLHIVVRQRDLSPARYQNGSSLASYADGTSDDKRREMSITLNSYSAPEKDMQTLVPVKTNTAVTSATLCDVFHSRGCYCKWWTTCIQFYFQHLGDWHCSVWSELLRASHLKFRTWHQGKSLE